MPKEKSRQTIRVQNDSVNMKHNVPRQLYDLIISFYDVDCVMNVGIGRFRYSSKPDSINIVGYDCNTKSYLINLFGAGYEQKMYLRTEESNSEFESQILEHYNNRTKKKN